MSPNRIYKYQVQPDEVTVMPTGARILSCGAQGHELFAWALVDPGAPPQARDIWVVGTGHLIADVAPSASLLFLDTVHMAGGLVFHLFEHVPG